MIRAAGGNTNFGVKIPEVDQLIDQALTTVDPAARNAIWTKVDRSVMENAEVLPGIWAKVLLYRPPNLTNVYVNQGLGGFYDYAWLGVKQ